MENNPCTGPFRSGSYQHRCPLFYLLSTQVLLITSPVHNSETWPDLCIKYVVTMRRVFASLANTIQHTLRTLGVDFRLSRGIVLSSKYRNSDIQWFPCDAEASQRQNCNGKDSWTWNK